MKQLSKRDFLIIFAALLFLFVSFSLIYYFKSDRIKTISPEGLTLTDTGLNYYLDTIENQGDSFVLRGWAYKPGENLEYSNNSIVLKDVETQTYYECNTKFEQRPDVTTVMNDGYDYTNSGFLIKVKNTKFKSGKTYQLCFKYLSTENTLLYETNDFLTPNP